EIHPLDGVSIAGIFVQDITRLGATALCCRTQPLTKLAQSGARSVLITAFDADRLIGQIEPYLPSGAAVLSLDAMRLPESRLTNPRRYLDPLNFATNFALFRDTADLHTRLVTANYWSGYGATGVACWLTLFDGDGHILAEWEEDCGSNGAA